jgi:hypothetical protein
MGPSSDPVSRRSNGGHACRVITLTTTVAAVDRQARAVTIRGPLGRTEKIRTQDAKGLESLRVGDLVQIIYTRALAIALDKRD